MNDPFVSVAELTENPPYGARKSIKEELFTMQQAIKQHMDTGLSADDMRVAQSVRAAVHAADDILDKLFKS